MSRKIGSKNKNHKEKPTKEKKQRGRPKGSIKQKQHQHQQQIVNVNINTRKKKKSDDEDDEKKKKKSNFQNMVPNIIFNPSIAIPQGAPISRPEVNPPIFDMNSLLQPVQQAISQKTPPSAVQPIAVRPTLIRPVDVEPTPIRPTPIATRPIGTRPIATRPITTRPIDLPNPLEPVNDEPYHPNPQIEQSHPTPHIPRPPSPLKVEAYPYNDVPGYDVINLASSIGLGFATGGASVAVESGIAGAAEGLAAHGLRGAATGALNGVRAVAPTMIRAGVAGGVATGVSHIVGAGPVGNVIAGVAGGLASRGRAGAVGGAVAGAMNNVSNRVGGNTRTRPRVRLVHEPDNLETSLLSSNRAFTGQRHISGGSRAVSRLVEPEIQLAPDTNHQNILSNIKDIANKTVASTGEAVSKLKGQITDAGQNIIHQVNRIRGRGRPRLAPLSDETGWEPYERQVEHPVSSTELQTAINRNTQKDASNKLKAAIKRTQQQINYEQDVVMDKELKAKQTKVKEQNTKMSKDILNNIINSSVNHSDARQKAAATLQAAVKRTLPAPKYLKEYYKKVDKADKATQNFQKLTQNLGDTVQYGNSQAALNEYATKRQNISNLGKLVSNKVKTANMIATKGDIIQGRAAEILQAMARRKSEKGLVNRKMENAGDILGGVKRERASNKVKAGVKAKLTYQFKDAKQALEPKYTGEPLVVLKGTEGNPTLILKRNHERGVKAAESRKIREDLQDKYKDIMKKTFKGQNRFNPL